MAPHLLGRVPAFLAGDRTIQIHSADWILPRHYNLLRSCHIRRNFWLNYSLEYPLHRLALPPPPLRPDPPRRHRPPLQLAVYKRAGRCGDWGSYGGDGCEVRVLEDWGKLLVIGRRSEESERNFWILGAWLK